MEGPYTRKLAEYISASRFEELPKAIVEHAKLLVLDTLGVGIFGATLPWSERLRATAEAMEAPGRVVGLVHAARVFRADRGDGQRRPPVTRSSSTTSAPAATTARSR